MYNLIFVFIVTISISSANINNGTEENVSLMSTDSTMIKLDTGMRQGMDWTVVWYLVSFGGLVTFFLVVSCSEYCCRKSEFENMNFDPDEESTIDEVPPPPYDLFAPPTYDSLFYVENEKRSFDVYVIPVSDCLGRVDFGEDIHRNQMGDGEVVTPPPPP